MPLAFVCRLFSLVGLFVACTQLLADQTSPSLHLEVERLQVGFRTAPGVVYQLPELPGLSAEQRAFVGDGSVYSLPLSPSVFANAGVFTADGLAFSPAYRLDAVTLRIPGGQGKHYRTEISQDLLDWRIADERWGSGSTESIIMGLPDGILSYFRVFESPTYPDPTSGSANFVIRVHRNLETGQLGIGDPAELQIQGEYAEGAVVRLPRFGLSAPVTADGRARFLGIAGGGRYDLEIVDGASVWRTHTVVPSASTIVVDGVSLSREQAFASLLTQLEAAFPLLEQSVIAGLELPVAASTRLVIGQNHPEGAVVPSRLIRNPTWVFMVDPYPTSLRPHPFYYALVDGDAGTVEVMVGTEPLYAHGVQLFADFEALAPSEIVRLPSVLAPPYALPEPADPSPPAPWKRPCWRAQRVIRVANYTWC